MRSSGSRMMVTYLCVCLRARACQRDKHVFVCTRVWCACVLSVFGQQERVCARAADTVRVCARACSCVCIHARMQLVRVCTGGRQGRIGPGRARWGWGEMTGIEGGHGQRVSGLGWERQGRGGREGKAGGG